MTKDASLWVLIATANGNGFVNDAAKNLKYNILRAEATGEALSEGKHLTDGELVQTIEEDTRDFGFRFPTVLGAGWST